MIATYELQDKRLVYVLTHDNKITNVAISTLPTDDGKFFIVKSGLKAGDKVVLEGLIGLRENMTIIPRTSSADSVYAKSTSR